MDKKTLIPAAAVLIIGIVGIGAYALYGGMAPGGLPKNPPILGTLSASTESSVTLTLEGGKQKVFSISTSTQVVTQAASGEAGKTLAQIAPGTPVMVQLHAPGAAAADSISTVPAPAVSDQDPAGPPVVVVGTILNAGTDSVTLDTASDPLMRISVTKDTLVLSNVLAGQKGKTLSDASAGTYAQVSGVAGARGLVARTIQLLAPLQ